MKKNKLDRYESKTTSEISDEHDRQNREFATNLLMPIIEKFKNIPPQPIKSSFADLLSQFNHGVTRQPVRIITDNQTPIANRVESTKIVSGDDTGNDTKYNIEEMAILDKLQND